VARISAFKSSDRTRRLVAAVADLALEVCGTVTQCPGKSMRRVLRTATAGMSEPEGVSRGARPSGRKHDDASGRAQAVASATRRRGTRGLADDEKTRALRRLAPVDQGVNYPARWRVTAMKLTKWLRHHYDGSNLPKWRRHHHDGSEGVVEKRRTGAFIAVDLVPLAYGVRGGVHRECTTLEDAFLEVDCAAERRGHTCTAGCTRWRRD
jgi:hypothetical protein